MAYIIASSINIAEPINVTSFNIIGFSVNVRDSIMDVSYQAGNMSTDEVPVFVPVTDIINLHIEGVELGVLLSIQPTLYPTIKKLLYGLIQNKYATTGTVV